MIAHFFMNKRRRFKRRDLNSAAVIMNGNRPRFEKACEIGEGGMTLRVDQALRVGEQIQLQLLILPGNHFVMVKGEVLYQFEREGKVYMGIRFINLDLNARDCIREFVHADL